MPGPKPAQIFSERGGRIALPAVASPEAGPEQAQEYEPGNQYGQFDNLEGLSVFRDWSGRIRLLMVSDDDRAAGRRSEIVDVVVNR